MTSPRFRIVIVGGGIAGLASAIALRGPGREITVLEQSRELREIGAAISLQPNATKILNNWGLSDLLVKYQGIPDKGFRIYNTQGQIVKTTPFSPATFGADRIVYHRVDLLDAFKEAALSPDLPGTPAQLHLAARVVDCDCNAGVVTLQDGRCFTGDLIVGADGIHSHLRQYVTDQETEAVTTGVAAYRLIVPTTQLLQSVPKIQDYLDPGESWTSFIMGYDRRIIMGPCRGGSLFSIVALVPDEHMHEKADTRSWTSAGSLDHLLESFAEFPTWIKDIFKVAPSLGLWQLRDLDPLSTWTRGRVILIGDAAHAMLPTMGQGASQSIEDAEALQVCLNNSMVTEQQQRDQQYQEDVVMAAIPQGDVEELLQAVFECRYERASLIQSHSRQQARPATSEDGSSVTLDPLQFQEYSCSYNGAHLWREKRLQGSKLVNI